ncbi:hypothetical protein LOZ61_000584 [Ophidiomyces ophidiicola]|nr:hypothetical protein LOZ61_000584 [Ophidiomyces ophidiicola]KAI1927656.1 hypothetical protein LOZ60_002915 [Ophidiomyces ophidiicola]KAI1965652.1 hypothetical protein LOZ59_001210 [Ophidiomyces ophidiicola]KAI1972726.1 hypothetical protein LOZ56_002245 [Ophidiomyces ophidiicola]KAI2013579.1 hypothetical protein LOZ49_002014 [Ophidiomyces ophidiicola]
MAPNVITQKVHPCLWFDTQALEAATFYTTIFSQAPNSSSDAATTTSSSSSRILSSSKQLVTFSLAGQEYSALNGGTYYKLSPALSLFISCDDQAEIDYFWENLLKDGGRELQCGWLTDRFGVSWQVVPKVLMEMIANEDKKKAERARNAMLKSQKFEIAALQAAFEGQTQ